MKNIMYTKPHCPYCVKAANILNQKSIPFEEVDISKDPLKVTEMLSRSNGRKTVPQIFINDTHVGGCDDLEELFLSGKLEDLLAN